MFGSYVNLGRASCPGKTLAEIEKYILLQDKLQNVPVITIYLKEQFQDLLGNDVSVPNVLDISTPRKKLLIYVFIQSLSHGLTRS